MFFYELKRNGKFTAYENEKCQKPLLERVIPSDHNTYKSGNGMITSYLDGEWVTFYNPTSQDRNLGDDKAKGYSCNVDEWL